MAIEPNVNLAWIKCARKRAFRTRKEAKGHIVGIAKNIGLRLKPYLCDLCGRWHLFTPKERK